MKPLLRRWLGSGILAALVLPVGAIFFLGSTQAQPGRIPRPRPFQPPPRMNNPTGPGRGPGIVRIWTCSRCGAEVGRGNFPPKTCPKCGARLINGVDQPGNGNGPPVNNPLQPPNTPPNQPPVNNPPNQPPVNNPVANIPNQGQQIDPTSQPAAGSTSASTSSGSGGDDSSALPWIMAGVAGGALLLALGVFVVIKMMGQINSDADLYEGKRRRRRRLEY